MDVLHTSKPPLGPISIDLIKPNLYLGGRAAAISVDTLTKYKITHILTIQDEPLPTEISERFVVKYIHLVDCPEEDLLSHLDETEVFISDGLSKGAVLVHCYYGVSRSASVVIAYIMKKYQLPFEEALREVERKRSINPNRGFHYQLMMYEEMGYKINQNWKEYKRFRLNKAVKKMKKFESLPEEFMDVVKCDPGLVESQHVLNVYQCKECARVLASESNIMEHSSNTDCTEPYFLEPLAWMKNITKSTYGQLSCPKCNAEVGYFNWLEGYKCVCGVKVVPAFYLPPSKINFVKAINKSS